MIPVQRPFIGKEELASVERVFASRWLGMGAVTKEFERELREFLGVKYAIAVNSGTSALHIALDSLVRRGDEVIVPSLTFVASIQAILTAGAKPVFCDVCEDTFNMDVEDALSRITSYTKVLMPVHFGGTACQMDKLLCAVKQKGIWIVEDAAHAFGSTYKGQKIGTLGDITCFSFDPVKNVTCGEGGAVVTDSDKIAQVIITKRVLGIDKDSWSRLGRSNNWLYNVVMPGFRYHMSNINAAIGIEQLKRFELFKRRKQLIVSRYDEAFGQISGLKLRKSKPNETFPFFYVVRVLDNSRDDMMAHLQAKGIVTGLHYIPNHLHKAFADFRESLPVSERLYKEMITLPLYYEMSDQNVMDVIDAVKSFFKSRVGRITAVGARRVKVKETSAHKS
jgi:perosamine synthetase